MAAAIGQLTTTERELLAMKYEIGADTRTLMARFGFADRDNFYLRLDILAQLLRAYFVYFALNDHQETVRRLRDYIGPGAPRLLEIFGGARAVYGGVKIADVEKIDNPHVQAFVKTLMEVSKYKRL